MDVTLHLRYTVPLKGRGLACSLVHAACNRGGERRARRSGAHYGSLNRLGLVIEGSRRPRGQEGR